MLHRFRRKARVVGCRKYREGRSPGGVTSHQKPEEETDWDLSRIAQPEEPSKKTVCSARLPGSRSHTLCAKALRLRPHTTSKNASVRSGDLRWRTRSWARAGW